jgi:hypothetical protein
MWVNNENAAGCTGSDMLGANCWSANQQVALAAADLHMVGGLRRGWQRERERKKVCVCVCVYRVSRPDREQFKASRVLVPGPSLP